MPSQEASHDRPPHISDLSLRLMTLILWLAWAWIVMTVGHELGHVLAGLIGGARLRVLELRPWHLPHSLFSGDEYPLMTLWAGPILGTSLPAAVALLSRRPATVFVAWFCLVANAAYLLLGYFSGDAELDSTKMIQAGASSTTLLAVSIVALAVGYWRFRRACADLLEGRTETASPRGLTINAAILAAVIALQAIVGSLIAARL